MMHTVNTLPIHSTSNSSNSSNIKRKKCNRSSEHTGNEKKIAENWNHLTLNEPVYLFHLKNSLFLYQTSSNRQQYFAGILLLHHKISLLFELWCNPLLIVDLLQLNHVERSSKHAHAHISAFISFSIRVFFRVAISCVDLFKVYCSMTTWTRQKKMSDCFKVNTECIVYFKS